MTTEGDGTGNWAGRGHTALARRLARTVQALLLLAIRAYQLVVRPLVGPSCRFEPSCSRYAATAIVRHGPWRGAMLALRRLLRCHPWHPGGEDPVPMGAASTPLGR